MYLIIKLFIDLFVGVHFSVALLLTTWALATSVWVSMYNATCPSFITSSLPNCLICSSVYSFSGSKTLTSI